jgi:hypothetical protein
MKAFIRPKTLLALAFIGTAATALLMAEPAWWAARGVIDHDKTPDDYAVVNQGQLKNLARAARDEMNEKLPGGAGAEIEALVSNWSTSSNTAPNYAAVNLGQIKALAGHFHMRLAEFNLPNTASWSSDTGDDDDHALANIGQAKAAFDFNVPGDADGDGINDAWEWRYWNGLGHDLALDSDGDGMSDGDETLAGREPLRYDGTGSPGAQGAIRIFNALRY